MTYDIRSYDRSREEDIKSEARMSAFFALRKAWKERSSDGDLKAQDLAEALGKDKGQISRILSGRVRTITLETLFVFLNALGYYLPFDPVKIEDLHRSNYDARPAEPHRPLGDSESGEFEPEEADEFEMELDAKRAA
jgi:transcriptional regulator with XRE-family HTH domain